MTIPGLDFATNFVRGAARHAAEKLADQVQVTLNPADEDFTVICCARKERAQRKAEPAEMARELERAVEVVMGLRPKAAEAEVIT